MKSKFKIFLSSLLALVSPAFALAVFNDVSLTTPDALISISSVNLTVQGGNGASVEQIQVTSDTFVPTMPGGSYFKVKSTDRRKFSIDPVGSLKITTTCTDTESTLELDNPASGSSVSPTVGVSSSTCAAGGGGGGGGGGGSSGGGGGGGGGGGAGVVASAPKTVPVSTPAPIVAQPVVSISSPAFSSNLSLGLRSDEVKTLQKWLNLDPGTQVASSGVGSPGNETNYFGPATQKAVQKFQLKYGVVSSPTEQGYGNVGPKTRIKLSEVFSKMPVPSTTPAPIVAQPSGVAMAVSPVFNSDLQRGAQNDDVRRLQELLAKDSSVYPDGSVTGLYGPLTEQAVRKFQAKYGLPQVGRVGPATRTKLQEVFGGAIIVPVPTPAPIIPIPVVPAPQVNPIQPIVPPATTVVPPPPAAGSVPFWMQLQPSPRAGGASVVDPLSPSSPSSPQTTEEKKAYAETLPFWMQLTQ